MPLYEYKCPQHGVFEVIQYNTSDVPRFCPKCGAEAKRLFPNIAFARVHHTEKLDYNDPLRVYDRQRMMKDSAVQKAINLYKEEQREKPDSPYRSHEV